VVYDGTGNGPPKITRSEAVWTSATFRDVFFSSGLTVIDVAPSATPRPDIDVLQGLIVGSEPVTGTRMFLPARS
jgi:hypothetical protein